MLDQTNHHGTVLVADDDRSVLNLIAAILSPAGYEVLLADGARAAIEAFDQAAPRVDLLLTDVIMPDLTGPVLATRLRARKPGLRVVLMSGFHDTALVQRYTGDKDFALVPKPFTPEGLLRAVKDAITEARR